MSDTRKLSKKQKKALAFRERSKSGKGKSKANDGSDDDLDNVVPIDENQDLAAIQMAEVEDEVVRQPGPSKVVSPKDERKAKITGKGAEPKVVPKKSKKRKLDDDETRVEGDDATPKAVKRAKKSVEGDKGDAEVAVDKKSPLKQRLLLFVGNLKYTTPLESIRTHFSTCDPPPTIRLLTPKAIPGKPITKSKGCAFLEFSQKSGLQQALKLHQSTLDGRRINVELTAGGGGKSEQRLSKLRERNKELSQQRQKRLEKGTTTQGVVETTEHLDPQRYSSTAGSELKPSTKRTWTVGDITEESLRGAKHSRQRKSKLKHLGTGVNAIPVG